MVAVVDTPSHEAIRCPRCGAKNDLAGLSDDQENGEPSETELVTQMLDTQAQAKERRQAAQEAAQAQRDSQREKQLAQRHEFAQRVDRLGAAAGRSRTRNWIASGVGLMIMALVAWAVVGVVFKGGKKIMSAVGVGDDQNIEQLVDGWVRSLSADLRHKGVRHHVYHVAVDDIKPEGEHLFVVHGSVHAADQKLNQDQAAKRVVDRQLPKLSSNEKNKLRDGVRQIKKVYDPKHIDQITGSSAAEPSARHKQDTKVDLRDMGFKFDGSDRGNAAGDSGGSDIVRDFVMVVRLDSKTSSFGDGAAVEYFVWEAQAKNGQVEILNGMRRSPISRAVDAIFTSLKDGDSDYQEHVRIYGGGRLGDLFPDEFSPVEWELARCDLIQQRSARAFVLVTDKDAKRSGTWILTFLRLEDDGQWRAANVWRQAD